jgi:hypothetical protein
MADRFVLNGTQRLGSCTAPSAGRAWPLAPRACQPPRVVFREVEAELNASIVKTEANPHFASTNSCYGQSAAIEFLDHPFSLQDDAQ